MFFVCEISIYAAVMSGTEEPSVNIHLKPYILILSF